MLVKDYTRRMRTFLLAQGGRLMTIEFLTLRGSYRVMNCRTGVKKHLDPPPGGPYIEEQREEDERNGILRVWDLGKRGYRSLKLERIVKIRAGGEEFCAFDHY
jgi:hypothetical protein